MAYQRRRKSRDIDYNLNDVQLNYSGSGYNHIGNEVFENVSSKKSNSSQRILIKNTVFRLCGQLPFCEQFDGCNNTLIIASGEV